MTDRRGEAPHVVMMVANDVANDTRVKKEAVALARAGLRVTLLGATSEAFPGDTWLGDVRIVRVPVAFTRRDAAARRRLARRQARPPLASTTRVDLATARVRAAERDLTGASGLAVRARESDGAGDVVYRAGVAGRRARRVWLRLRRHELRVRRALAWRLNNRIGQAWREHDLRRTQDEGVSWRREHPEVLDYEAAFGPALEALSPDAVHAHDMHLLRVASRAAARARRAGRRLPWVYDAHEYVPGLSQYGGRTARVIAGWADLEADFVRDADRVVTVSPAIAVALKERYDLPRLPTVVLNVPTRDPDGSTPVVPVREVCGLGPDVPLISYSGAMQAARGVQTAIDAMVQLPDVHLALVCVPHNDTWYVRRLRESVEALGVQDRVHLVNPVGPGQVVDYLRGVDVGLIPGLSFPSHEMSLPNKLFEYLHAGVPVASSELESLGAFLREHGVGETFTPGDVDELAAAVRAVLADRPRYRAAVAEPALLQRYSWSHEAGELRAMYAELLGLPPTAEVDEEVVDLTETTEPGAAPADRTRE